MSLLASGAQLQKMLLRESAFIDVRAPIEFVRGAIPGAVNLPLLNTAERELVGTCYKREGQQAAVALGRSLVHGAVKEQRVARWCEFARTHPDAALYCWRGGLRSRLSAQWMAEAGQPIRVIEGGFKALRNRLLRELQQTAFVEPLFIIGGRTGSAKTALLQRLPGGIDLEACARHRGSSFGRRVAQPPSQIDFENSVALALLRHRGARAGAAVFLEDESRHIGAVMLPPDLQLVMKQAPLVVVEMPLAFRIEQILNDYIRTDLDDYVRRDGEAGFEAFGTALLQSLQRIQRRLGMERYAVAERLLRDALAAQQHSGEFDHHRAWIELLLRDYYDPMYEYQLGKSAQRVVFRGNWQEVLDWCLYTSTQPATTDASVNPITAASA